MASANKAPLSLCLALAVLSAAAAHVATAAPAPHRRLQKLPSFDDGDDDPKEGSARRAADGGGGLLEVHPGVGELRGRHPPLAGRAAGARQHGLLLGAGGDRCGTRCVRLRGHALTPSTWRRRCGLQPSELQLYQHSATPLQEYFNKDSSFLVRCFEF